MSHNINRREAIAALTSATLVPLMAACRHQPEQPPPSTTTEADASPLVDEIANNLLRLSPESAPSLGIDTGTRSSLRSQLSDRSAQGQHQIANQLRTDLQRANTINVSALSHATRTSFEVVRSAYATAIEAF